ncbi:hypothetical protein Tco_0302634 [Tanacetum coccineum]
MQGEGHIAKQCTKPKRKRDETWFNDKVLLVQAQAGGQALTEEEIAFLADPGLPDIQTSQTVITHNAGLFKLMNGSDALTESETDITSDSNIIPYSQYLSETQQETVQNSNSSAQQDVLILSMFDQLSTQVTHCTTVNKALTTELDRYKEEVKDLKEKQNVENSFSGSNEQFDEILGKSMPKMLDGIPFLKWNYCGTDSDENIRAKVVKERTTATAITEELADVQNVLANEKESKQYRLESRTFEVNLNQF